MEPVMDENEYEKAKQIVQEFFDKKNNKVFSTNFEEHCCHPVVDNVIKMLGYIVKDLEEYRSVPDIVIYKTLIMIIYGLHYGEQSRDIYTVVHIDMYIDLSLKDGYSNGVNLSRLIRKFFLLPNPRWNDAIENIVELYLQVRNNPDLIQNI